MSETARSDDSDPSLSTYPPAFTSLITAFVTRAEEAESRAHKALVILQAKDQQVVQLQQRMENLEKIAVRLEEVMVPPLQLPPSPESSVGMLEPHHRESVLEPHPRLETLYERRPTTTNQHQPTVEGPAVHNCYSRCQHLIDGLERSNRQLREALADESRQRMRDHEQYVESLARVTRAVRDLQATRVEAVAEDRLKRYVLQKKSSGSSAYHTPKSHPSSIKIRGSRTLHVLFKSLRRKNKKTTLKYQHVCEKFRQCLDLCGKLKAEIESLTGEKLNKKTEKHAMEKSIQTDKAPRGRLVGVRQRPEKPQSSRSVHLLQGRLDAAGQVMARQQKQIQELQQMGAAAHVAADTLRKRLSRAESALAGRELVSETQKQRVAEAESRANKLAQQVNELSEQLQQQIEINNEAKEESNKVKHELEEVIRTLQLKIQNQMEINSEVVKEKNDTIHHFEEMKRTLESKLNVLSSTLREKEEVSGKVTGELGNKLISLKQQFVSQLEEAKNRLIKANGKTEELYLGVETFLRLLFGFYSTSTPRLSRSSQASAVQMASDILDISPDQIQTLLHTYRHDNYQINKWIKECNRLVHNNVFANDLGQFLLGAVLETRHSRDL